MVAQNSAATAEDAKKVERRLEALRQQVEAAAYEFDMATMFHEAWRAAMDNEELPTRMGVSYATNTLRVILTALRREALLALMRLWDKRKDSLRMDMIAETVRDPKIIELLAERSASRIDSGMVRGSTVSPNSKGWIAESVRQSLIEKAQAILDIADKYTRAGERYWLLEKLRRLRHERLAHHEVGAVGAPEKTTEDWEIELFYQDNSDLIGLLLSLVKATAYNPADTADIQRTYAKFFWAGVRGEKTVGHPNYRPPPRG